MITGSISSLTNWASGNVSLTVSSNQPFTTITYNDDPQSGSLIEQGNLCSFILTPYTCNLPTPNLSANSLNIPCLATTTNLNSITASNTPNSSCTTPDTLTWHSGTPATGANTLGSTIVGAGTYYASFYDAISHCYSTAVPVLVTATPVLTPTFTSVSAICSGGTLHALPTTSLNGITGTWSPALNNTATTTYTFTPTAGLCATTATMTITVTANVIPTFTQVAPICSGGTLHALPTTSLNGITGTWSPALNNTATTTYTFTPSVVLHGQCIANASMMVVVNQAATLVAVGDNYTYAYLQSNTTTQSILNNDTINGVLITGTTPNVTIGQVAPLPTFSNGGITLNADGTFNIQAYTSPGTYIFYYQINYPCSTVSNTVKAIITIKAPSIVEPGKYEYYPSFCFNQNSQTSSNGLFDPSSWGDNVGILIDGVAGNQNSISIVPTAALPSGLTLNTNGKLTIAGGLLPNGNYSFNVMLYPKGTTTNGVGPIPVQVFVGSTIYAQVDQITFDTNGNIINNATRNVLANDWYASDCMNGVLAVLGSNVNITASTSSSMFSIIAGIVNNASGIYTAGNYYTLSYTIQDINNPTIFSTANVEISIVNPLKMSNNNLINFNHLQNVIISPNPSDDQIQLILVIM